MPRYGLRLCDVAVVAWNCIPCSAAEMRRRCERCSRIVPPVSVLPVDARGPLPPRTGSVKWVAGGDRCLHSFLVQGLRF